MTNPNTQWNQYRKTTLTWAIKLPRKVRIPTREGEVVADENDYLALDSDGYPYPIDADEFENIYELADDAGCGCSQAVHPSRDDRGKQNIEFLQSFDSEDDETDDLLDALLTGDPIEVIQKPNGNIRPVRGAEDTHFHVPMYKDDTAPFPDHLFSFGGMENHYLVEQWGDDVYTRLDAEDDA